jgi:hypothetical protein
MALIVSFGLSGWNTIFSTMKNQILLAIGLMIMSLFACKSDNNPGDAAKQSAPAQAVYPVLPAELYQKLYNEADYLDFIFHNFPFSMSQKEKPSIQLNVSYIDKATVMSIPQNCKPIARQFYQIEGEIILEADVYYGADCNFYVFHENGKASYANMMSQNGVGFFQNIIQQAMNAAKQIGG